MDRKKVRVWVEFRYSVPYVVEVKNPKDLKEIKEALMEIGPEGWEVEPDFYETFADRWEEEVESVEESDIEEIK